MSAEQETKQTEETNVGGNLDAAGSASGAGSLGASANSKKTEEKRKPKKLGQKSANGTPQKDEADTETNAGGDDEPPSTPAPQPKMEQQSRSKSRQASRGRGRGSSQPPSDTDSAYRSDVSQKGKRNRNRNRGKAQAQSQAQSEGKDGGLLGGGGGPLDSVDEVGETVNGVVDGAGDLVNDTAGKALGKPQEALGGLLSNKKGGKEGEEGGEDPGENEQLRLRLDINLDIEVQLKAKIHGDLTLGLLYVRPPSRKCIANVFQELVLDQALRPTCIYHRPANQPILVAKSPKWSRTIILVIGCVWMFVKRLPRVTGVDVSLHLSWPAKIRFPLYANKLNHDQNSPGAYFHRHILLPKATVRNIVA
jgi:hypothetical protein